MAGELVWEDPPPRQPTAGMRGRGEWQLLAQMLAEHPGKWALVEDAALVRRAESVRVSLVRAGCEVVRRKNADRTFRVYARWPEVA